MDMIPIIALGMSTLAVATSVAAVFAVRAERRPTSYQPLEDLLPPKVTPVQSIQIQPGGITIDESSLGRRERIAREAAERIVKQQGRHL